MEVRPLSLNSRCRRNFDQPDILRGTQYFNSGKAVIVDVDGSLIEAQVQGSEPDPYDVVIGLEDERQGIAHVDCSCPRFADEGTCKHLVAALCAADADKRCWKFSIGKALNFVTDEDEWDDGIDGEDIYFLGDHNEPPVKLAGLLKQPRGSAKQSPWRKQLKDVLVGNTVEQGLVHYGAKPVSQQQQVWFIAYGNECELSGQLVLRFVTREPKKSGGLGKPKSLDISQSQIVELADPADREALELLLGSLPTESYSYYSSYASDMSLRRYSRCTVSPAVGRVVLPQIASRGRLLWADHDPKSVVRAQQQEPRPIGFDTGAAWQFRLHVERNETRKDWEVTGRFHRDTEAIDVSRPTSIISGGLMLLDNALVQVELGRARNWIRALRQQGPLSVPNQEQDDFLEQLYLVPQSLPLEMPDELRWPRVEVPPQPRIVIKKLNSRYGPTELGATVSFDYAGQVARPDDLALNFVDRAARRVVVRDFDREMACLAELKSAGLRNPSYYVGGKDAPNFILSPKALGKVVAQLTKSGWQVEAEGRVMRTAGEFKMSVSSGVDWFDLSASLDFDGVSVSLPKLLAAVRQGQQFVQLDDGSQGMLPDAWLAKFGSLAGLGEVQGEAVRFRPSQAMFLDALLAAAPTVEVDARFDQARKKLRSFNGVQSREAPAGFNGQLRGYQRDGLGWLRFLFDFGFGGCLADDMGLGKTIQVLALLEERRTRRMKTGEPRAPSLVVAPRSLIHNWVEEARRFTPKLRVLDYTGLDRAGTLDDPAQYDLIVTTYATARLDILMLKEIRFDYAILDEAQAIKNHSAQSTKACRLIQADHRLAMTGTPVENHLGELWSIFEFLNPGMLGGSEAFRSFSTSGREQSTEDLSLLSRALRPFLLRRTKEQVLTELPEKTEQTLYCELEKPQRKLYDELREHYRQSLSGHIKKQGLKRSKIQVLEALLRLRQAACHPGLLDKKQTGEPSAKLDTLLEQLREVLDGGHKALVFSQFTSLLDIVRKRLDGEKISYAYLDGKTTARQKVVEQFQNDESCRVFLISLKAGGLGLNLTAADYVFILDPWWNPAVEAQAVDRAHRLGQTKRVFAYRLIARDTVEEKILQLQGQKKQLADAIISADGSLISQLTADDLQVLLS